MVSEKCRLRLLATTILCCALSTGPVGAKPASKRRVDPRDQRIEALEAQVSALTKMVTEMHDHDVAATAAVAAVLPAPAPAPVAAVPAGPTPYAGGATILAGKPSIQSGDGRFAANLHGVMQFDAANYFQRAAGPISTDFRRGGAVGDTAHARDLNSGTNFRRARIGIDGKLFGDFDYNILFEYGGAGGEDAAHIQELWLQYTGLKPFKFKVGAFPPSIGLEDQGSTNGALFLERPAIADIARSVAGGDYREAVQLSASGPHWLISGALTTRVVGTINSTGSSTAQSFDQAFGGIARVVFLPIVGDDYMVHVGAHGSRVFQVSDNGGPDTPLATRYPFQLRERAELRVEGTRLVDTGAINAKHVTTVGAEFAVQKQQFLIQAEYEHIGLQREASLLANPRFSGWYVEGGWVLTGERRKYNTGNFAFDAPTIDHPLDFANGTFGAVELAMRYSVLNLNYNQGRPGAAPLADSVRGGEQKIYGAGINWYVNPAIRFMFDFQHVDIDRLSPNAATYSTPVGAEIGQKYNVIAVRSQLAF
jgi:phosphate-selective porin OprO/OprP